MNQADHSYYQERLSAYADNELPPNERTQVELHLEDCAECRRRLDELRRLEALTTRSSGLNDSAYWEQAARRIEAALPDSDRVVVLSRERKRHSTLWWRLPAIAASVVFLVWVGLHERDIIKPPVEESPLPAPTLKSPAPEQGLESPGDTVVRKIEPAKPESAAEGAVMKRAADKASAPAEAPRSAPEAAGTTSPPVRLSSPAPAPATEEVPLTDDLMESSPSRSRERSAAAESDAEVESEVLVDEAREAALAAQSNELVKEMSELERLRLRRDSLMAAIQAKPKEETREQVGTVKGAEDSPVPQIDLKSALAKADRKDAEAKARRGETMLIETWFEICRRSPDSAEVAQGLAFLEAASTTGSAEARRLAGRYLKELDRK